MKRRFFVQALLAGWLSGSATGADRLANLQEQAFLRDRVRQGALPPIRQRIPEAPLIVERFAGDDGPGRSGGQLVTLVGSERDTRLMTVFSYTRLLVYDEHLRLQPDVLASYEVAESREFTLRLRPGHKWSDGQAFTSEDFRYFWEDVANNMELSPYGPPVELLVEGRPPKVRIIDATTIRYTWDRPNPYFIASQARAAPLFLYRPSHYLKGFHRKYTPEKEILKSAEGGDQGGDWATIHRGLDAMYGNDNPNLPTLNPWINTTPLPARRLVFVRNPFFHRIDGQGQQLPYIDHVIFAVSAPNLVPMKAGLGEADLQARYLGMRDYAFLKRNAQTSNNDVRLWEVGSGSELAFYPNFNTNDEVWRDVLRDVRVRRALSLAIDRDELNQVIFAGLAVPSNNIIMPRSPLFRPDYAARWATYDPALATSLLDQAGLSRRDSEGFRTLPDGRRATMVVEHTSEKTADIDALLLVADHWRRIGIEMLPRPQVLENFRLRVFSGAALMTAYAGAITSAPTADTSPREFAPTMKGGLQWSRWGMYYESSGREGEKCDWPPACSLLDHLKAWETSPDTAGRRKAWDSILAAVVDGVFSIGTVNGTRQPIVVSSRLRNVPKQGYYAWNPGGYFGLYRPETFWIGS